MTMRFYVAFDDTDILDCGRGTGKLARWYSDTIPVECKTWGIIRHQLLYASDIPMTSHNSSLCCVIDTPDISYRNLLLESGIAHIRNHYFKGSDPGFCVAAETDKGFEKLVQFGIKCTSLKVSQKEAINAAKDIHLSGHGGTNDGIIGAAAAVGLSIHGESGRLISYRDIRELPQITSAGELRKREIYPISVNRHADYIPDNHSIDNLGSLRPHVFSKRLIIPVLSKGPSSWVVIDTKKEYTI